MKSGITAAVAALLLLAASHWAWAGDPPDERADASPRADGTQTSDAERSLAEAQRRLEEAAREVAELSLQVGGPAMEEIRRIRIGGPGRAMLGINIDNAEPGQKGARVVSVSPGGPAAEAGVKAGDLVVAVNGSSLATGRDLVAQMREVKPGDKVDLDLRRDGRQVRVVVLTRPRDEVLMAGGPAMRGMHMERLPPLAQFLGGPFGDAELVAMTPALGRYFGTDKGLLVVRAPAYAGDGLEDGDVILAIGGREPQNPGHAMRILASYQPGETVELKVLRQKKERTVRLTVPEASRYRLDLPPAPPAAPTPPAPPAPPTG